MFRIAPMLFVFLSAVQPAAARESQAPKSTVRDVVTLTGTVERGPRVD